MKLTKLKARPLLLGAIVAIILLIGVILFVVIMPSSEMTPSQATPTSTFTQTPGPAATGIGYPTFTPTVSPTATGIGYPTLTPTVSPTPTGIGYPTPTPTVSPTATGIGYPTPTVSPTRTPTPSPTTTPSVNVGIDAPDEVSAGGNFSVWVNVSNVYKLAAANYDITYDPNVSVVTGVDCGSGVIGGKPFPNNSTGFSWSYPEKTQGRIRILQFEKAGAGRWVSGSGYMARVYFHVVGSSRDSSTIELSNGELFKSDTTKIPANWISDSVHVK